MSPTTQPIGVFDSGVGGLTVLAPMMKILSHEKFIYLGDTARLPYGSKSPSTIHQYSQENIDFLLQHNVKAIVIACNTAASYYQKPKAIQLPIYQVIQPGADLAAQTSLNQNIGVLGTRATVASESYVKALKKINININVYQQACPLLVPLAEEGLQDDPITNLIVYRYVQNLLDKNIDTLILGCTHYPILKKSIQKAVGQNINLIESGQALGKLLLSDINNGHLAKGQELNSSAQIYTTDESSHTSQMIDRLMSGLKYTYTNSSK